MVNKLADAVPADQFVVIVLAILLIAYFCYKEWPEFKARMSKQSVSKLEHDHKDAGVSADIKKIREDIIDIKEELSTIHSRQIKDYERLNRMESETKRQKRLINEGLQERKMLMRGIIACLDGLGQQGCTGTVSETKRDISEYLNEVAHACDGES